jgi:hypothetical protein
MTTPDAAKVTAFWTESPATGTLLMPALLAARRPRANSPEVHPLDARPTRPADPSRAINR